MPADVVGFARDGLDLALIKSNRPAKFPTIAPGNSKSIRVGDSVYAIGTPLTEFNQNTFAAIPAVKTLADAILERDVD